MPEAGSFPLMLLEVLSHSLAYPGFDRLPPPDMIPAAHVIHFFSHQFKRAGFAFVRIHVSLLF